MIAIFESAAAAWEPCRHAAELWALEPEPRDLSPLDRIRALSSDRSLHLLYVVEELRAPTYKAVLDLPEEPLLEGTHAAVLAKLGELIHLDVDKGLRASGIRRLAARPGRALVRIVQELDASLVRNGDRWRITRRGVVLSGALARPGPDVTQEELPLVLPGFDTRCGKVSEWIELHYSDVTWCVVGRDGAKVESLLAPNEFLLAEDMEPVKFFRALAVLRGYRVPRLIGERLLDTAPLESASR